MKNEPKPGKAGKRQTNNAGRRALYKYEVRFLTGRKDGHFETRDSEETPRRPALGSYPSMGGLDYGVYGSGLPTSLENWDAREGAGDRHLCTPNGSLAQR